MPTRKPFTPPPKIHADDLEKWSGLSDRRMRQLAKLGYFPNPTDALYQFRATITGLLKYEREQAQLTEIDQVKFAREKDKARQEKVAADTAESLVVNIDEGRRVVTRYVSNLKNRMLAISKRVGQRFALESDPQAIEEFLDGEIREAIKGAVDFKFGLVQCKRCKKEIEL